MTAQRGAADLYTNTLHPRLADMHLPWTNDAASPAEPWSALKHVEWASTQTPGKAAALAAQVPLLLECYIAVERCAFQRHFRIRCQPARLSTCSVHLVSLPWRRTAAQADWMRHVACAVDASPLHMPASGMQPAEAQMRLLQRALCALHARTLCVVQVRVPQWPSMPIMAAALTLDAGWEFALRPRSRTGHGCAAA